MPKKLERDLGLPAVIAISVGAMVGSGIFILPGLAMKMAGPAVILAYGLAALLVLPAALSKSEMATAMPEAGGTYLYIERGMGPILGTIAGVGTWFSLTFKGALALVGGAPYLVLLFDLPVMPVAVTLAVVLIAVNLVGAKQTGRLQVAIVLVMLAALVWFVAGGVQTIETASYDGFFDQGAMGILAATGFVFVSYAGVTKVASVAEEVENPDRNIPLGILGSLVLTSLLYVALVAVMVGTVPGPDLSGSVVPMALAAENVLSNPGVVAVVLAAMLALVSTANAGILSSSRYPFAMSRDGLAPKTFQVISDRFDTPVTSISLTGAVLLALVVFVPLDEIAKLASAFQILVFVLVNLALVAFREGAADYEPSFESPLYPLPQVVGVVGGLVLLPFIGLVSVAGAALIVLGSLVWYYFFVYRRGGVDREGAATDVIRRSVGRKATAETESVVRDRRPFEVLVAVDESTPIASEKSLVDLATAVASARDGAVRVVRFDEVPDQTPLGGSAERLTPSDEAFEERMAERAADSPVPIEYGEVVSHDTKHAIVNRARNDGVDAIVLERHDEGFPRSLLGSDDDWIERHAPCTLIEAGDFDATGCRTVAVVADERPYDPEKVLVADAIAGASDATLEFVYPLDSTAPESQRQAIREYLDDLTSLATPPMSTTLVGTDEDDMDDVARRADVLVLSGDATELRDRLRGIAPDVGFGSSPRDAIVVHGKSTPGPVRRLLERVLF